MSTPAVLNILPSSVADSCGVDPTFLCGRLYDLTNGNGSLTETLDWLFGRPLSILFILVISWTLTIVARRYVRRLVTRLVAPDRAATAQRLRLLGIDRPERLMGAKPDPRRSSRASSTSGVVGSTLTVLIWTVALILIIGELGFDLGPFIAGAGIAGVALGFGAQSLVKDCIAGVFMLIEDQYGIGDVVDLGEATGKVEEVTLRTTVLRGLDGTVWHVPNGEVQRVGNKSQLWSVAVIDVDVAYDSDLDRTRELMLTTANELCVAPEWADDVLAEPSVLGVEALGADGITMRMIITTTPGSQWALQRKLREMLKLSFDAAGIEIPFPQRTLWMRNERDERVDRDERDDRDAEA